MYVQIQIPKKYIRQLLDLFLSPPPFPLKPRRKHIFPVHLTNMGNRLKTGFLFTFMTPSFALPFNVRINANGNNLSASVATGIVIALCASLPPLIMLHRANILAVAIFLIPLLWCAYKIGTRARRNPTPPLLFTMPPPTFPITPNNGHSNMPSSSQMLSPPRPAHKKTTRTTYRG